MKEIRRVLWKWRSLPHEEGGDLADLAANRSCPHPRRLEGYD